MINKSVISSKSCNKFDSCDSCLIGKSIHLPHTSSKIAHSAPQSLIHADIWAPSRDTSVQGFQYYVNFVDVTTNFNWVPSFKEIQVVWYLHQVSEVGWSLVWNKNQGKWIMQLSSNGSLSSFAGETSNQSSLLCRPKLFKDESFWKQVLPVPVGLS